MALNPTPTTQNPANQTTTTPTVNVAGQTAVPVTTVMSNMVNNPSLPVGGAVTAQNMQVQAGETLDSSQYGVTPEAPGGTLGQATTTTAQPNVYQNLQNQGPAQMQASTIDSANAPQMEAAQGQLRRESTMRGQYESLMDFGPDEVPDWARGAVKAAQQAMAARGLGSSSIAAEAITGSLMQAALPIAQTDAQLEAGMDMQNLQNRQEAAKVNLQYRAQTMFNNQAFENAARQFNAQSEAQHTQFFANLATEVEMFNVDQQNAMEQFNVDEFNAMEQFRVALQDQRERFNANNRLVIDQSNAEWRRNINTVNTATQNAVNQINAQNILGLSNTALNNLWQQYRDEAEWIWQSGENDLNRAHNLAIASFERDSQFALLDAQQKQEMAVSVGSFFSRTISNLLGGTD